MTKLPKEKFASCKLEKKIACERHDIAVLVDYCVLLFMEISLIPEKNYLNNDH